MAVASQKVALSGRMASAALMLIATLGSSMAVATDSRSATYSFDIPAQKLNDALQTLALTSQHKLLYSSKLVDGRESPALKGEYTAEEALSKLLSGTKLVYQVTADGLVVITGPKGIAASLSSVTGEKGDAMQLAQTKSSQQPDSTNKQGIEDIQKSPPQSDSIGNRIQEIVVTAQKREEKLQDVPVSIAVIGNQEIERRGLIGMEDYLRSIPGVNQIDQGPISNAIVIRGVTTSPTYENFYSGTTVGSYFDETPITGAGGMATAGIDVRPVDIERIEVLRGPQGTTYGSASLGGTLRMIPVKPKLNDFGAKLGASYSDTSGSGGDNSMFQGVVNLPLVMNKFALRAVGYRFDESGFYRNMAGVDPAKIALYEAHGLSDFVRGHVQDNVGRIVSTGGRLAALWQATDKLSFAMNFLTQKIEQDGSPVANIGEWEQSAGPIAPQARLRGESGEVNDTDMDLVSLTLNFDLGWGALTSIASWIDGGSAFANDASGSFAMPASTTASSDFRSVTAETRLTSQLPGRIQFLGGIFYEDVEDDLFQTYDWPGEPGTNFFGTDPMLLADFTRQHDQSALFGEISYDLTDRLTATMGGRYFKYGKDEVQLVEGGLVGTPIGEGVPAVLESSEDNSTFKANVSYKLTPDSLLFASWAEGFRLGRPAAGLPSTCDTNGDGLIDGTNTTIESTRRVESDSLENYEIGGKFTLFDRRMVIDTSVYHIKWNGLPTLAVASCGNSTLGYTANVGGATSTGVEFQASIFAMKGFRIDFGGGYTKAELSKDALDLGAQEGARLPGSPKVSANLAAQYEFEIVGYEAFVRADSFYAGDLYAQVAERGLAAGDYIKVDARAGVAVNNLSVELFVRNLTNEDAFTWPGGLTPPSGYRMRPRTVGIQFGYNFQ